MNADEITKEILGAAFEVLNTLGNGFSERVYERALVEELRLRGLRAKGQAFMRVCYKGKSVGEYFADVLVEEEIVVELKCAENLVPEHLSQCLNYLRASDLKVALLLNFQRSKLGWQRIVNKF
jgi:GxxExxY protein